MQTWIYLQLCAYNPRPFQFSGSFPTIGRLFLQSVDLVPWNIYLYFSVEINKRVQMSDFHHDINAGIWYRFHVNCVTQLWFGVIVAVSLYFIHVSIRPP